MMVAKTVSADPLADFKHYTMAHPKLGDLHNRLLQAVREPGGVSLIFVLGPTGVGKTTLISRLMRQITSDLQPLLQQDREKIAVVGIEAEAPIYGNYDFKQHFRRSLNALGEILIDHKIDTTRPFLNTYKPGIFVPTRADTATLRIALENTLKRRRPAAFFIDEAHHLGKVSGGRKVQDHLDVIKSLANMSETIHVLVGTYELHVLLNLSDQLSRRSRTFHFERYNSGRQADLKTFHNILWSFQQHLPFSAQQDLRLHSGYLMERSLGCIGILKCWFLRAADLALSEKADTLSIEHLKQLEPSDAEWHSIATALLEGEEALRVSDLEIELLRSRLSQKTPVNSAKNCKTPRPSNGQNRSRPYPGERRPHRDPIGKNDNVRTEK